MVGERFRWQFIDDCAGKQWSGWHVDADACSACCCFGPYDGEHLESASYYEDGELTGGHSRASADDDFVEWES